VAKEGTPVSRTSPNRPRCLGRARVGGRRACFLTGEMNPAAGGEFRGNLWKKSAFLARTKPNAGNVDSERLNARKAMTLNAGHLLGPGAFPNAG
jgi:hypothetical protein